MSSKLKDNKRTRQKNVPSVKASSLENKQFPEEMEESSTFGSANSLKPEKPKSSPVAKSADSDPTKTPTIIAYVHNLSPSKRNRRNTCDYSTVELQTSSEDKQEALLYSPHKRSLFLESERCRTPIKLQKFTYTDDEKKLIINDMTIVSVPKQSEYSFQYANTATCRYQKVTVSEAIENCKEWDAVEVVGKIVKLGSPHAVHRKGQIAPKTVDLCEAVLADSTGSIRLDVWAENIKELTLGYVYRLRPVGIRLWSGQKKMSTTVNTRITVVDDDPFPEVAVQDCDDADVLGEMVLQIENILSVEKVEHFSKCRNCTRKLVQVTSEKIVRCDRCGHSMRLSQCEQSIMAKIVVAEEDGRFLTLMARKNVLETVLDVNVNSLGEGEIAEKLLTLENLKLKYNAQSQIVSEMQVQ